MSALIDSCQNVPGTHVMLERTEARGIYHSQKAPCHPKYNAAEYLKPQNLWIREHLQRNHFVVREGDPSPVVHFAFYLQLDPKAVYTFTRNYICCRMNVKYFEQLAKDDIASPSQSAYLLAVNEHNDPGLWDQFKCRDDYLKLFCEHYQSLHELHEIEIQYLEREIARRKCKQAMVDFTMLDRERDDHFFRSIKEINNRFKYMDDRIFLYNGITERCLEHDHVTKGWGLYVSDTANPKYQKYKHDENVFVHLVTKLAVPWIRGVEAQVQEDARRRDKVKHAFDVWSAKLARAPRVPDSQLAKIRMDSVMECLAQLGLGDEKDE